MAFTTKLDTNVVSIGVSSGYVYTTSAATIELNNVVAYHTYIKPDGTVTEFTALYVTGAPSSIIVTNTYAAIDSIINP
tara:strand:- start:664 stop:897 length:234 start_codon:yes stop_codon:yes gene_type:complete